MEIRRSTAHSFNWLALVALCSAACGPDTQTRTSSQPDAQTPGTGGSVSDSGTALQPDGAGGAAPSDAALLDAALDVTDAASMPDAGQHPPCPASPPIAGSDCPATTFGCTYLDCAMYGHVRAVCVSQTWFIVVTACGNTACGSGAMQCTVNQLCRNTSADAALAGCIQNTCPAGLLSCDCLDCGPCVLGDLSLDCGG
jgi:hypothetical protein